MDDRDRPPVRFEEHREHLQRTGQQPYGERSRAQGCTLIHALTLATTSPDESSSHPGGAAVGRHPAAALSRVGAPAAVLSRQALIIQLACLKLAAHHGWAGRLIRAVPRAWRAGRRLTLWH